jgi:hypothetical protein
MGGEEDLDCAQGGQNTFLLLAIHSLALSLGSHLPVFPSSRLPGALSWRPGALDHPRDAGLGREVAVEAESVPATFSLV